jgi:transcriptional regulator with XRE-family HTH domain
MNKSKTLPAKRKFMNLRHLLLDYNMTYESLANMLGVSVETIRLRMNGKKVWKLPELQIMSKKFNKSIEELTV